MSFISPALSSARRIAVEWSPHAKDLISKRYLLQEKMTIHQWIDTIAHKATKNYLKGREVIQKEYFELLHGRYFLPTSAALHNILRGKGSLAGCIVVPLSNHPQDVIEKDLSKITRLLMKGIGVGLDLSPLLPRLHPDARTGRCHSGPVQTLKALTAATDALVDCGGVKKPAYMGALSATHPDIAQFIALKQKDCIPSANISVSMDSEFKSALFNRREIPFSYLMNGKQEPLRVTTLSQMRKEAKKRSIAEPDLEITSNGEVRSNSLNQIVGSVKEEILHLNPQTLLFLIAHFAHACGDPGLIDLEAINLENPTHSRYSKTKRVGVGEIRVTTPCGEQPLLPYEVCHLGSFNLAAFTTKEGFDFASFQKAIPLAVQLMDDLINLSDNQLEEANEIARTNRKIGIGVMGLADTLAMLDLPYASPKGFVLAEKIAKTLQTTAHQASENLALIRGAFKIFAVSKFALHKMQPRRHATLTTIAPTGHISTLADCSTSIEPYYLISYRRNAAGIRLHENRILAEKLAQIGWSLEKWIAYTQRETPAYEFDGTLKNLSPTPFEEEHKNTFLADLKKIFLTAGEISPEDHLKMVATFQRHVDNGVSKTINLPHEATVEDIYSIFMRAIAIPLKGITVYRDRCQSSQALFAPENCSTCEILGG